MRVFVAGATGATGRLLAQELLDRGHAVTAVVRSPERLPGGVKGHERLAVIHAGILDLGTAELARHVAGCDAVASCLGHTISLRGIFGHPRRLVAEATRRLCDAVRANGPAKPVKFVLMNTTANRNRDLDEPRSLAERAVFGLVRLALPPHADNEAAADYVRVGIGRGDGPVEWVVVRPDTLTDDDTVAGYAAHPSPTRSPVFDAGTTSRANVARFMADLIADENLWGRWRGRMPVVYNETGA